MSPLWNYRNKLDLVVHETSGKDVNRQFDDSILYGCEIIATILLKCTDVKELLDDLLVECDGIIDDALFLLMVVVFIRPRHDLYVDGYVYIEERYSQKWWAHAIINRLTYLFYIIHSEPQESAQWVQNVLISIIDVMSQIKCVGLILFHVVN